MNGFSRTYFAVLAALAARIATRRQKSSKQWTDRAERWRTKAERV